MCLFQYEVSRASDGDDILIINTRLIVIHTVFIDSKKSATSGINFISGGFKKSSKDEANEKEESADQNADDMDVDPLLQHQFGKPRAKPAKHRKGFRSADQTGSQG